MKKEDAFIDSDKNVFNGLKLEPWTPNRVIAAQGMGMLFPRIGPGGWDQFKRTKIYAGALRDVIICLWLCTLTEAQVDNADAAPIEAYKSARKWAAKLGIHKLDGDEFWEAFTKFSEIMVQVESSITFPKKVGNDEDEDEPGKD